MAKSLVLFFSRKGTNYVSGEIKTLEKGNAARYMYIVSDGNQLRIKRQLPFLNRAILSHMSKYILPAQK